MELQKILQTAAEMDSSDIHLIAGHPPMIRAQTHMTPLDFPTITPEGVMRMLKQMAGEDQMKDFEKIKDADFSFEIPGLGRYRVNAHLQRATVGIAMRSIKTEILPLANLNLPEVISRLTYLPRGLVLVTGVTGSGKTEVYFEAVARTLEQGRQALIMLPEIALTSQFLDRFERRFGAVPVEWHSALSPHERGRIWRATAT